ncbi:hypothetical protein [Microbulbifer sp. DLAB2-AA]|uniref:hypothetical protein n=1 Tax=Microbulbifer sp. DLAB2-AA TaxID=3243394 RepID=UPI00403A0061
MSANFVTWLVLFVIVVMMGAVAYTALVHFDVHFKQDRWLLIGLISIPVLIGSLLGYLVGGYKVQKRGGK